MVVNMQTFYFVCCLFFVVFTTSEVHSKNVTIICPEQRIHAERLKCEIHEHCNSKYHCRVHPCYNHKICINKHKKIQQCPIKSTSCPYPDLNTAIQHLAPIHRCTGSGDCPPAKRYSSLHKVNRCCEHECFLAAGSRICRRIERVYREWSTVQEGTSTGTRVKKLSGVPSSRSQYKKTLDLDLEELKGGIGAASNLRNEGVPGAMQNAIMMNVMFMIVAALVYLWVIFKTG